MANNTQSSCILGGTNNLPKINHIISAESGAAYDISYLYGPPYQTLWIFHKPYRQGEHSHVLSYRDGKLYTAPQDPQSNNQKWVMTMIDNRHYNMVPYLESSKQNQQVLQYDNGFLSVRPKGNYNGQKWILNDKGPSTTTVRSCPLNTSNIQSNETLDYVENQALHNNYQQQMGSILNLIQSNLQHFDEQTRGKTDGTKTVSTVFGSGNPINLKVNVLGGDNNVEKFNSVKKDNVLDLLNRYQ